MTFEIETTGAVQFVVIDDWVSTSDGTATSGSFTPDQPSFRINAGPSQNGSGTYLIDNWNDTRIDIGPTDGLIWFDVAPPVTMGDTFVLEPNFLAYVDLLDPPAFNPQTGGLFQGNVFLADQAGNRISNIVALPEPSTAILILVAMGICLQVRRKTCLH